MILDCPCPIIKMLPPEKQAVLLSKPKQVRGIRMKIPFNSATGRPRLSPVSGEALGMALGTKGKPQESKAEPVSFQDLLKKMTTPVQALAAAQDPTQPPLSPQEASALSQRVTMQINETLIDILSDQKDDHQPVNPYMGELEDIFSNQIAGKGILSKIRQIPSETGRQGVPVLEEISGKKEDSQTVDDHGIESIIQKAAEAFGVDSNLIKGVIQAESSFNPTAVSDKGAMGLMQLMPDTARELGVNDPLDPTENVMGGTRYLKTLLDRYEGSTPLALAAYNWGMGNLDTRPGQMPEETRNYVAKITGIAPEKS
jgi:hypothetical protein